ncbi:MAG: Ig-like domain repeat protein [Terracidiphilus sp.]
MAPAFGLSASPTSVAVGDLNGDGRPDLVLTKKGSGSVTVLLGNGKGGFNAGVDYPAATRAANALLADLNGDGRLEVVVTDSAAGAIDVLAGNGDGTLGKPVSYAAIANPVALAAGSFTGNGKLDLAVAGAKGLAVLLNDGSGHFSAAVSIPLGSLPRSLAAADLRNAGHDDLALANQDGTVSVLLGDGAGNFHAQSAVSVASGPLSALVSGDFNGDGKRDLAVSAAASNTVTVLLGRGDGSFEPGVAYAVGNGPASLIAANLRGSGVTDLVSVNQAANTFSVLAGNGDGTFRPSADFTTGNTPLALAAGDFNGDGKADLAILNSADATISVPLGRGDGTFVAARAYRADLERKAIASGDLNGDGRPDLVVSNFCGSDPSCASIGTATVFLAKLDGTYKAASTFALGAGPVAVALADLNGDNKLDLLALNRTGKSLMVMPGNGDGTFGKAQIYALAGSPRALFVGDFNGDGKPDLAIASDCGQSACTQPGALDIWLGRGDGTLAASATYTVGFSPASIAAGDLHGTGHLDVIVANTCGDSSACTAHGTGTLLAGDGTGKFTQMGEIDLGVAPSSIALGKLTGSGLDLAVAERGGNQVAVLHANGSGGFGAPVSYAVGKAPSALTIADFNGDGMMDVAAANFESSTVSVLYGTGTSALHPAVTYPVGAGPDSLVAVTPVKGGVSNLVTANGNSGATPMGNDITALGGTDPGTATSTTTLALNTTGTTNVNQAVSMTATVTGNSAPTGTVTFTYSSTTVPGITINDCNGTPGAVTLTAATATTSTATCVTNSLLAGTDSLVASYSGDTTYEASDSSGTEVTQVVDPATTGTTVASSSTGNTTGVGLPVTYTATVTPSNANVALSSPGTVTFTDNTVAITCSSPLSDYGTGTFTCTTTYTAPGTHAIVATYAGDPNYSTSFGTLTPSETVTAGNTTVTVVTSGTPSSLNSSVTFTATLNLPSGATAAPSQKMTFTDNGNAIAACPAGILTLVAGSYQLACTTGALTAGNHSIVATYPTGDTNYGGSSGAVLQVVSASGSGVSLISSLPAQSAINQAVLFTATVTPVGNTVPLTGTVALTDGAGPVAGCTVAFVPATGKATCTTSSLSLGSHTITATYSGDPNYPASGTSSVTQKVVAGTATIALGTSGSPSATNAAVTFTATLTANPAVPVGGTALSGTVSFTDTPSGGSATPIPNCSAAGLTAGVATCTTSSLSVGSHTITAAYNNDTNYTFQAGGNTVTQTVNAAGITMALGSSANPATVNQTPAVTFTATITYPSGGTALSGTVAFTDNGASPAGCAAVHPSAAGVATCTEAGLSAAASPHTIAASYTGDTNYGTANATLTPAQTVNKAATTLAVVTSGSPSAINGSVTFTATLTFPSGSVPLTGAVAFTDSVTGAAVPGCSSQTVSAATGVATCTTASLALGSHTITATYTDSSNNFQTSSNTVAQSVGSGTISMALASSANPGTVNQTPAVTFTATITYPSGGTGLTGTVAFTDNGVTIPGCNAVHPSAAGLAPCTPTVLDASATAQAIAAAYTGDTNFGNANATLTPAQTVNKGATSLALGTSGSPSAVNGSVTFTATLTFPSGNVPLTGSIAFTDSATSAAIPNCATVPPSSTGVATCTTTTLGLGSHTITATYTDSANNFQTSTNTVAQTVGTASITMTLSAPSTSGTVNQSAPLTFDANITAPSGTANLTGTVAFTDNGTVIATCPTVSASANGTGTGGSTLWLAVCADPGITAATSPHTIAATYSHDTDFGTASATLATKVTISPAATAQAVTAAPNPSSFNQSVTFTATLTFPAGGVSGVGLSGNVAFTDSATAAAIPGCGGVSPSSNGVATCSYSGLANGTHTITATFANDLNFATSSNTVSQSVGVAATSVNLSSVATPPSSVPNTSVVNQPVTFTATVSSPAQGSTAISGTISFLENGSAIASCTGLTVSSGEAQCPTSSLPVGADTITANYSGSPSFGASSNTLVQTVTSSTGFSLILGSTVPATPPAGSVCGTTASCIESGQSVTFTATITPAYTGSIALNGSMVFTDNSTLILCTVPAASANFSAAGVATCTVPVLPDGANNVVAGYTGDTKFTAISTPAAVTVVDYSVAVAPVPSNSLGVQVTEGYKSTTDPFPPQPLVVTPSSISNYNGTLTLSCATNPSAPGAPVCGLGATSLAVVSPNLGSQPTTGITLDASKAVPGTYNFTLTATDVNGLIHAVNFPVTVRATSATPLQVASGATTGNTANVVFTVPAGVTLSNFSCPLLAGSGIASGSAVPPLNFGIACSFGTPTVSGTSIKVPVTVTTNNTIPTAGLVRHTTLLVAGLLGIPFFGLFGLLRGRRRLGAALFRLVAILGVSFAAFQTLGCGGSFHSAGTNLTGGTTPAGVYYLLVEGTGSDGNVYEAVLQVDVTNL